MRRLTIVAFLLLTGCVADQPSQKRCWNERGPSPWYDSGPVLRTCCQMMHFDGRFMDGAWILEGPATCTPTVEKESPDGE